MEEKELELQELKVVNLQAKENMNNEKESLSSMSKLIDHLNEQLRIQEQEFKDKVV